MLNEQDITFLLLGVILAIIGSIFLLSVRNKKKTNNTKQDNTVWSDYFNQRNINHW